MAKSFTFDTRARLLIALIIVLVLGIVVTVLVVADKNSTKTATVVSTATIKSTPSQTPVISPSPTLTAIPSPTDTPIVETTYQTSGGLRYADRDLYQEELSQTTTMAQASQVLSDFLGKYGVSLWTTSDTLPSTTQLTITWNHLNPTDSADLDDTKTFGSWLIDEWSKYPKAWVKVSNIQTVALVKNLASNGNSDWGEASPIGVVFYQVTPLNSLGPAGEDYMRRIIHHEFDHEVELQVRGGMQVPDSAWSAFNPAGFAYGKIVPNTEHPYSGFVTGYSESAIGEDKAELYSFLMVDADSKKLSDWDKTDSELANKVAYYKASIKKQVPIMDDSYFRAINP